MRPAFTKRALVLAVVALGGCRNAGSITGVVAGGVAGGATANPAVGYAVGLGVKVAATAVFQYVGRVRQHAEQDAIAAAAGPLPDGTSAAWKIEHDIGLFDDKNGSVTVVRTIANPIAECREIAFSVKADKPNPDARYLTTICKQARGWTWAEAEPAVERWGYLQ